MAERHGVVVQGERLRDQVYRMIRNDLRSGVVLPGERIREAELAERYNVSRTPVREALFQLSREGVLVVAQERGYMVPRDTLRTTRERHEVRDLLDPALARHVAEDATPEQRKALTKAFDRQRSAHLAGRYAAFVEANHLFRTQLRTACRNQLLARCSALIDDQFQSSRNALHKHASNREITLDHDARLLAAIVAGDGEAAHRAMQGFIDAVRDLHFGLEIDDALEPADRIAGPPPV